MAAKLSRQLTYKTTSAKANKKKQRERRGRVRELPQNARPPAGPALQPPKTNGAEAPGNVAAFRASAPEENKEHTKRDKENHMSWAGGPQTNPPPGGGGTAPAARRGREEGAGPPQPGGASTNPPGGGGTAPTARRGREEGAGPPRPPAGAEKRGPARPDRAELQPTRRPPGLAEPPAGAEKRGTARRDRAVFQPPPAGQGASTHPPPRRGRRNNPHPAYASGVKRSVER